MWFDVKEFGKYPVGKRHPSGNLPSATFAKLTGGTPSGQFVREYKTEAEALADLESATK